MTMEELVQKLNEASEAYYNGREIMTDLEFDQLFDQLKKMEEAEGRILPNSPTHNVGAKVVDSLPKFTHPYPAKSLDKTKDIDKLIIKFRDGISASGGLNDKVVLMWKEDGATVQAYYNKGKLDKLVTRGNGEVGSVITHNARCIEGLPLTIPFQGELVVRGEALMSYEEFERINSNLPVDEQYKNPRNLAAATLTMLDSNEACQRHLVLKAFNLVHYELAAEDIIDKLSTDPDAGPNNFSSPKYHFSSRLDVLDKLGFSTVERNVVEIGSLKEAMIDMTNSVETYPFPVDGLVVAMDNYGYAMTLEGTEHHPNVMQGYAFKWADEVAVTTVKEIEWSPSRTGLLNPVAIFDPVELYGTTVSRASIHNVSIVSDLNIRVGDQIEVTKSNMIIPYIVSNLDEDSHVNYDSDSLMKLVGYCPVCGAKVKINHSQDGILTAFCPNMSCPEKMIGKLDHFCARDCMDIRGMSEETIKKLVDKGFIKEYADLFNLTNNAGIAFLPGFGKQSWKKMCDAAEEAKKTTFIKFITALSIPNIGKGQAKVLYRYLSDNYEKLCDFAGVTSKDFKPIELLSHLACDDYDFSQIDGFGKIMSTELSNWLRANFMLDKDTPETRVYRKLIFTDVRSTTQTANSNIAGKSFCITGKLVHHSNRQELVAKIESFGGRWIDSVSSKTDYLINNDLTSTSGKNKKAKDLNIPIISEEEFLKMVGGN